MTKPIPDESENPFDAIQEDAKDFSDQGEYSDYKSPEDDELRVYDWDAMERSQNIGLKDCFATHVICITYAWMTMVIGSVIATGICAIHGRSFLSDAVLITLLSATSLSAVLGLFCIILRYLFNPRK